MKLGEDLKLTITRIEEQTDYDGNLFFKCKGFSCYKTTTTKGRNVRGYNQFSTIRLYPINQEQYESTKQRLFEQTCENPMIQIVSYDTDITTPAIQGRTCPILVVWKYDFTKNKLFKKKAILNYGKENNYEI
jgi:hypothetical protein